MQANCMPDERVGNQRSAGTSSPNASQIAARCRALGSGGRLQVRDHQLRPLGRVGPVARSEAVGDPGGFVDAFEQDAVVAWPAVVDPCLYRGEVEIPFDPDVGGRAWFGGCADERYEIAAGGRPWVGVVGIGPGNR